MAALLAQVSPALTITDNFTDASNWGTPLTEADGNFSVGSARMNYTSTSTAEGFAAILRNAPILPTTQDWSLKVDVHLNPFTLTTEGQFSDVFLGFGKTGGWQNTHVTFEFGRGLFGTQNGYYIQDGVRINGVNKSKLFVGENLNIESTESALRLDYNAANRAISYSFDANGATGGYNWVAQGTADLASGTYNLNMGATDTFTLFLLGSSGGQTVASGQAYLSNLEISVNQASNAPPAVTTTAASGMTATTATLNGTVNPNGLATTAQFEYGLTTAYGSTTTVTLSPDNSATAQNVSADLTGLVANTTYHYRLSATNASGATMGNDLTFATASPASDFTYTSNGTTITITRYTGTGGDVNILEMIDGLPVTRLEDEAFNGCASVTSVTIPASLTSIGDYVFEDCSGLVSISVNAASSSFSSLDGVLFDKLKTTLIQYPEGKAGTYMVPATVTSIWAEAFYACRGLSAIAVESGNPAFSSADGVLFDILKATLVRCPAGKAGAYPIPASVKSIDDQAFQYCASLTSITIPNGVTRIGDEAFEHCPALTGITIPASVTSIGTNDAFGDCANLLAITVDAANPNFSSAEGVLFDKLKTTLIQLPRGKAGSYTIPAGVTRLDDEAFASCAKLTSVTIPASVTNIGNGTFAECTGLTNVTVPNNVTAIGWEVFAGCTNLACVTLPAGVTSIGDQAFEDCPSLTAVYFNGSAPTLGWAVFAGDINATAHYLPGTAGWAAWFGGLPTALLPFTYTANAGTITITGYTGSRSAVGLPGAINGLPVTRIGNEAFQGRASLTGVTLPTGITDIGNYAFQDTNLTGITIPGSVTRIGDGAFEWCHRLTSVRIPASVTTLGEGEPAFIGCTSLSAITVNAPNPSYSSVDGVLFNKNKTTLLQFPGGRGGSYPIPSSVTSIGFGAFAGCPSLSAITVADLNPLFSSENGVLFNQDKSTLIAYPGGKAGGYTIPTTVTNIENGAFCYSSNLSAITIPNTVTRIGFGTFALCTSLTSVTIPTSVTSIADSAFWNCTSLASIAIPANVTNIGDWAFEDCSSLTRACFLDNAPSLGSGVFDDTASGFKVYYFNDKSGFTSPTWNGYPSVNMGNSTPVATWLLSNGFSYNADMQSDPNGDGVNLLLAYALNLDPNMNLAGSMPQPSVATNQLTLTFRGANSDVTYAVQSCTDLQSWSTSGVTLSAPDANGLRTASVPMTAARRFMRLVVSR